MILSKAFTPSKALVFVRHKIRPTFSILFQLNWVIYFSGWRDFSYSNSQLQRRHFIMCCFLMVTTPYLSIHNSSYFPKSVFLTVGSLCIFLQFGCSYFFECLSLNLYYKVLQKNLQHLRSQAQQRPQSGLHGFARNMGFYEVIPHVAFLTSSIFIMPCRIQANNACVMSLHAEPIHHGTTRSIHKQEN